MRSKLFVPAVRPDLFAKAMASGADAVSFDLEDSVPEDRKAEARAQLAVFLRGDVVAASASATTIIVRSNAVSSESFAADLEALAGTRAIALINLPKIETPDQVRAAVAALERIGLVAQLLLTIETPGGLRHAADLARAHPSVAGLQLGLGDLFEPYGIDRRDPANLHAAMNALRLAAAEAGVFAYDGAFADVQDDAGFRAEAGIARRLGFLGKSCIHPRQIALANAIFSPSEDELAMAQRIVAAAAEAAALGLGAFLVDGRMIDRPYLQRAQAIVAAAER